MNLLEQKRLDSARAILRFAERQPAYQNWLKNARDAFDFYSGVNNSQFLQIDLDKMQERKQVPVTFNVTQSHIKTLSGVEIKSRRKIAARIDLEDDENMPKEQRYSTLSKSLTHVLLHVQKNQNMDTKYSEIYRDAAISGLGWGMAFKENGVIRFEQVPALSVIPDLSDTSMQLSDMAFVCKAWFLKKDEILRLWPHAEEAVGAFDWSVMDSTAPMMGQETLMPLGVSNSSSFRPKVWEVQHKESEKAWQGFTKEGTFFQTFDYDLACEVCTSEKDIEEFISDRIVRTVFLDNTLLETGMLDPSFPGQSDFSYIPVVWERTKPEGMPYGLIDSGLKGIQMALNAKANDALYYACAAQYHIEGDLMPGMTVDQAKKELSSRTGAIVTAQGSRITKLESRSETQFCEALVEESYRMMQRVTGVHDELQGAQTNATSAIAQRVRQVNSVTNNVMGFDALSLMRERVARLILQIFQNSFFENYEVEILDDEESMVVSLNAIHGKNGEIVNNVSFLPVSLYFEEIDDIDSSLDEKRANAIMLAQNPQLLSMPSLLKDIGLRSVDKYIEEAESKTPPAAMMPQGQSGLPSMPQVPGSELLTKEM